MKTKRREPWYVYGLRCSDKSIYIGITNDVKLRVEKHNTGKGAKYTKSRLPVKLIYSEKLENKSTAMKRERKLKQMPKAGKEMLVKKEPKSKQTPKTGKELIMKKPKKSTEKPEKAINPYWVGGKFLEYCVKQKWLRQDGSGARGTSWYPTPEGKKILRARYGIKI